MMDTGPSKEEQLARAREERANIVQRYDKGREPGAVIDSWEDPDYELYHMTDIYGFIHDSRLPDFQSKDSKRIEIEKSRSMKWAKMIKSWDKYKDTEKLIKRVYKGIPLSVRGCVWSKLLGLEISKKQQKGKYEAMKKLGRKWSTDVRQIDLDVNRTYRDHDFFRLRYDVRQQQLFHVLVAYSMYNQEIGYCQGMSQIAALLLIYLNEEEDAFWALSTLMADHKYAMHGFFIPGFPKLLRYQEHHNKILEKSLPKLKKHLEKSCIDAGLYTLKWFFQCFLDRVPFSLTLRLWDIYLLEGERLLVAMAYTVLKLHRRPIMRLDMDQILDYIQKRLEQNFGYDDDYVIESLEKTMEELKKLKLAYPGPPPEPELPQKPFGIFVEPSVEQEVGLRGQPSEEERRITKELIKRQDTMAMNGTRVLIDQGSQNSLDKSIDEVSSLGGVRGSHISLANTSLTSAADLSTWSSSRKFDADNDSLQSGHSFVSADGKSIQSVRSPRSPTEYKFYKSSSQSPAQSPKCFTKHSAVSDHSSSQSTHNEMVTEQNGVFDSPSQSPSMPRPSQLSVSQATLVREEETILSEPATPKATETPDTVRIFVPYSPHPENFYDTDIVDRSPSPPFYQPPHFEDDIFLMAPSPNSNIGDAAVSSLTTHFDPHRIKIQVEGDNSYSDLPSPKQISHSEMFFKNSGENTYCCSEETFPSNCLTSEQTIKSIMKQEILGNFEAECITKTATEFTSSTREYSTCTFGSSVSHTWPNKPVTLESPEYKEGLL